MSTFGRPGFSFTGFAQGRNGAGKVPLLEADHPELGMHFAGLGAESPQRFVGPGGIGPATLREGLLTLCGVPLERTRLRRLSLDRRPGQAQPQDDDQSFHLYGERLYPEPPADR